MMIRRKERHWTRRLAVGALGLVVGLWAAGASIPGARAELADLVPSVAGSLPRTARGTALPAVDGVVLVAPRAGRFFPGVADRAAVARGAPVGEVDGWRASVLDAQATAAAQAQVAGAGPPTLLADRVAASRSLAAAARTPVAAPQSGTVRWLLPAVGPGGLLVLGPTSSPERGVLVQAGQPLGVLLQTGQSAWVFSAGPLASGPRPGQAAQLMPQAGQVRVAAASGDAIQVVGPGRSAVAGGAATLAWGAARGDLIPAGAVVWRGGTAWVLAARRFAGGMGWVQVRVLTTFAGRSAIAGLPAGAWVAARPWLGGLWAAWP
jgi:hypothetical protein